MPTLALDVYGTLIDTAGVAAALEKTLGADAAEFAARWRAKQLEYTFRYGLMRQYRDFRVCTRQALEFCNAQIRAPLSAAQQDELMREYLRLPAFADARPALRQLQNARVNLAAFSNGQPRDLAQLLRNAKLDGYFKKVVSVDEVGTFKPDPAVYRHFLRQMQCAAADCWLVSGNSFDICGAAAAGWRTVWLRRDAAAVFDPWEFRADMEISTLGELPARFAAAK